MDADHQESPEKRNGPQPSERATQKLPPDGEGFLSRRADTFRARLNAPITVIIDDETGKRVAIGTANLRDLSLRGALITELHLAGKEIVLEPERPYFIKFRLMTGPLAGLEAECSAVRYDASTRGFGVRIPEGFRLPLG